MTDNVFDLARILEEKRLTAFTCQLIAFSWLITFLDGLDSNLVSYSAPYFAAEFHLTKNQIATIFSAHQLGTLIGGIGLVYLGDILGRRPMILASVTAFGALTVCYQMAGGYTSLLALRFLTGLPLGGVLPLVWALNIEFAPRAWRSTVVTLTMLGYSLGTAAGGPLSNWLAPGGSWKVTFVVGGCSALVTATLAVFFLPESPRFMVARQLGAERIAGVLRRFRPDMTFPASSVFTSSDEPQSTKTFHIGKLFAGPLALITPLLWLSYVASSFAVVLILNWTPIIFEAMGFSRQQSALVGSLKSMMGALAGVLLMRFTDTRGVLALTVLPLLGMLSLLIAGTIHASQSVFILVVAVVGFSLNGGHFGMHSICGIFYPSAYRANGAGWATSIAKIGGILGPLAGGILLSSTLEPQRLYALLAICPFVYAVCVLCLGISHRQATQAHGRNRDPGPLRT